ncbi:MAG: hypothetical protein PHC85_01370 [Candidatus Pacebacteria bacterium]|nr:hypothetical protein [Candidatus Paceibacterota bacterium]
MFNKRNLIFILSLAILAVASYYIYANFFKGGSSSGSVALPSIDSINLGSPAILADESIVGKDFVEIVTRIRNIEIDTGFFGRSDFKALKDLTPVIPYPDKIGRENPFAPANGI